MVNDVRTTSLFSYNTEIRPTLGSRQELVYNEIASHDDITNSELSGRLGIPINTITPRVYELRKSGVVIESRKRDCMVTGRTVIAWKVNNKKLF